jgi:phosphoribosylformimino-5-aminoimidazole carboxamide ribotide isomerase
MKIFPAIDIIEGKVVRLTEGDYGKVKNYDLSAIDAARSFYNDGARCMHVVDLDGAKSGEADNAETIEKIVSSSNMFVEVGGGIRSEDQIKKYLDNGVSRVILGTIAVKNFSFVESMIAKYGDKICVGVDAYNGKVAVNGWREVTKIDSVEFCKQLRDVGVNNVIYTDISRDGGLKGTNLDIYRVLCQIEKLNITASGGITFIDEIKKLKEMNIYGAILGKALYENKLSLKEVVSIAEGN